MPTFSDIEAIVNTWDKNVTLCYAAEELLFVAQALTTDTMRREQGLLLAHSHLHNFLQYKSSLPSDIGLSMETLDAGFSDWEKAGAGDHAGAASLTASTLSLLGDVQNHLAASSAWRVRS